MTTSTAEADPGLLLSRGNWILLALLVGHTGGGRGVCHLSWSFEKAQLINYLSLACMVADLRQPCKSSRLISVLNYYKRQSSHRSRNYKTFCNRGGATYSMNWQMTRTTIWAPNTLRLPRQLANPPSPLLTTLGARVAREFDLHVWPGTCTRLLLMVSFTGIDNQCLMS